MDRDQLEAIMDEAHKLGMRTATHIGVEETTAKDYVELGVNSIEHFYGVADAALDGIQNFPPDMNYSNEIQRFGRAGRAVRAGRPGEAPQDHRPDGREPRRVESDVLDLRGEPRPDRARRRSPGSRTTCIRRWRRTSGLARQPRLVLHRLDEHPGSALEAAVPHLDGRRARIRQQGRTGHHRRRCRLYLFDVRLRHLARARAA